MPKMKTHSGAAKRFKKSGNRQDQAWPFYEAPHPDFQATKRKRQLDTDTMVDKADQKRIARMIPYA